ncbi:zinc ribbon domain-containing protein [Thermoanaerobacteraceae bacterium SP2]|nr:zinc ribbon domain-containing protein [Thermoanaerobacteraceae bacterium SP2]
MYYNFICNKCGEAFEIEASVSQISKGLKISCSKCSSSDVRRDYSTIFIGKKGSTDSGMVDIRNLSPGDGCAPGCGSCGV